MMNEEPQFAYAKDVYNRINSIEKELEAFNTKIELLIKCLQDWDGTGFTARRNLAIDLAEKVKPVLKEIREGLQNIELEEKDEEVEL